jgi:hypothetical protein
MQNLFRRPSGICSTLRHPLAKDCQPAPGCASCSAWPRAPWAGSSSRAWASRCWWTLWTARSSAPSSSPPCTTARGRRAPAQPRVGWLRMQAPHPVAWAPGPTPPLRARAAITDPAQRRAFTCCHKAKNAYRVHSEADQEWPTKKPHKSGTCEALSGGRCRVRTCDPCRVKAVLYH